MSLDHNSFVQALRIAMMLGRTPRTPFLENQKITKDGSATAVSVAVQRLDMVRKATRLYIACVLDGVGRVYYSFPEKDINDHKWTPTYFHEPAEDIAISFNGIEHYNGRDGREFITDDKPWVFWVKNGYCYGRILGLLGDTTFASDNCTKVDAICDIRRDQYFNGYGLILFMVIDGDIYYRQLLNGIWTDAEKITFGPNVIWVDIQAFRTWDYRIGLQGIDSNGNVYEMFSQYSGIGRLENEFIELDIEAQASLTSIRWNSGFTTENISIDIGAGALYGGLYRIGNALIIDTYNVEDSNQNWGTTLIVKFDRHLRAAEVAAQPTTFKIVDSASITFTASSATLGSDGLTVTLRFNDFNPAYGQCSIVYTPGTIHSMASVSLASTSYAFTPSNLNPPVVPIPVVIDAFNI